MDLTFIADDIAPTVADLLGVPYETAHAAVVHTLQCTRERCLVEAALSTVMIAVAAELVGLTEQQIREAADAANDGANATADLLSAQGVVLTEERLREIAENGTEAMVATIRALGGAVPDEEGDADAGDAAQ